MAGIEKYYEITEVYAWQWEGNTNITICKKCGKTNKECFPTTIEEYDMYIEMLCENCLTEILDKKITAIKPKK